MILIIGILLFLFLIMFIYCTFVVSSLYSEDDEGDILYYERKGKQGKNKKSD